MPTYSSFAVAGAGGLGGYIIKALLAKGVKVVVFTRSSSSKKFPPGAAAEEIDYESQEAIRTALTKHAVEVVISTLSSSGFEQQSRVADAAKLAGVKLFVPSEFGMPTLGGTEGIAGLKDNFAKYLESISLPSARFYVGFFASVVPWLTGYSANGKINIVGKGESPVSFTAEEDIAGFVAHVLTEQPAEVSRDKIFRVEGDRHTFLELASLFKTEAVHVESVPGDPSGLLTTMHKLVDTGIGSTGYVINLGREGDEAAGSANHLWAGHHWKTVKEIHNL